jgi:hypothetical protein
MQNSPGIIVVGQETPIIAHKVPVAAVVAPGIGSRGPQGPMGPAGSSYVHDQSTPAAIWTINHNLNRFPAVSIVDSSNKVVEGDIEYLNSNSVRLTFAGAFSGKAYMN